MKNDSQSDSLTDTADQADLLHAAANEQPANRREGAIAGDAAGNEGGEDGAKANGVAAPAKSAARTESADAKPAKGVFGKLHRILGGDKKSDCTCGRAGSGKQGRHHASCPVSGGNKPKHFQPVVLENADAPEAGDVLPFPSVPTVPPDYSLWGRLAKTTVFLLEKTVKKFAYHKCKKVLSAEDARECADDLSIDEKEIKEFSESATRCAEHYKKNPNTVPLIDLCLQGSNIGVSLWAGFDRMDERLRKIQAAKERAANVNRGNAAPTAEIISLSPSLTSTKEPD